MKREEPTLKKQQNIIYRSTVFAFLKKIIDLGYMAMFSDFSLKALINKWDSEALGSNPFEMVGIHEGDCVLKFRPGDLKECPSAQLQLVGDLSEEGKSVQCMQNTILYSINPDKIDTKRYKFEVLSINISSKPKESKFVVHIDGHQGTAGHVLLRYESGGCLLTSMGHWVELMKIDTSEQKLFDVVSRNNGMEAYERMRSESCKQSGQELSCYIKEQSVLLIQSQAPCMNLNFKKKD